jgi:peroxiredoxin
MSLKETSAAFKAAMQKKHGAKFSVVSEDNERVRASGVINNALKIGQSVPDFTLPDAFGKQVSLKELRAQGPVVISFYRGEWCPFCNLELRGFQEVLPKMQELGATLIAISPEKPDRGVLVTEKNQLLFPVLSDFGNTVARKFGIVFRIGNEVRAFMNNEFKNDIAVRNGEESYELPVPATYVVDTKGVIRFANVDVDFMTGRAEPQAVIAALEAIALTSHQPSKA